AYHLALARASGVTPQVIVNIGGVANVTYLDAASDPLAFDTGPGNALIDDFVAARTGKPFDDNGTLARAGSVNREALQRLLDHQYFRRDPPKSLDRNAFSLAPVQGLSVEDGAATLTAFTARTIALAAQHFPAKPERFVVAGGGRRNAAIMDALKTALDAAVLTAEQAGWRGDDVEAEAFAYLAIRALKGLPLSWPTTTGVPAAQTGGVVHRV
ncbi:MAG: anhydro-N-acetylmuramic acid kinase, partial [Rhizobiales bacterium]|nr:anhydro-N-acetylmuramic acid kinase [Hyphomicrobiales bacterium]